ncbi:hypothetical protein [Phormidesmis priestleyi]
MAYSDFTLRKAKEELNLTLVEGGRFLPQIEPIAPSPYLLEFMQESLPLAIATGSEKARSELIISPILVEVRRMLDRQVSVFSGEDFTVAPEIGLNGICDFLLSQSPEQMLIEAPVMVIVEAKKGDLKIGIGQCIAEMVAAQRFNAAKKQVVSTIYGSVTSGTTWRFLKLEEQTVTADLTEYSLPPIEQILSMLVWMMKS